MPRPRTKQVPTEEEIKPVLPNAQPKTAPMQGYRRLMSARKQSGLGNNMGNLLGLNARKSPWGGGGNV